MSYFGEYFGCTRSSRSSPPSLREVFVLTFWKDKTLLSCSQAGFVNNLNDAMSWGIYPLFFSSYGLGVAAIGVLKAEYPIVWGLTQVVFGPLSDRLGRKWLIAGGLIVQAVGIWQTARANLHLLASGGGPPGLRYGDGISNAAGRHQ